jgi:hypothetical protein
MGRRGHGEGSVFQRNDGRWAATISLENGKRNVCDAATPPRVKRYEIQPLNAEQVQLFLAAGGHRLEALFVLAHVPARLTGRGASSSPSRRRSAAAAASPSRRSRWRSSRRTA